MGGVGGSGFHMQQEGSGSVDPGLAQPPGNLPFLKPDDTQYFGKLLVSYAVITGKDGCLIFNLSFLCKEGGRDYIFRTSYAKITFRCCE